MQQGHAPFLRRTVFEQSLSLALRPILRAYVLGYASSTLPRLLTLVLTHLNQRRKKVDQKPKDEFLLAGFKILRGGLDLQRFPTFCATLVGGSTLLELPLKKILARFATRLSSAIQLSLAKCFSAFISAWLSLKLLQSKESSAFIEDVPIETLDGRVIRPKHFAGRTMDLTLFAVTRALDAMVGELWSRRKDRKMVAQKWTRIDTLIAKLADPAVFSLSCALVMWSWIYAPSRLPRSYNKWIKSAASVDERLLTALRRTRWGEIQYGVETGQAHVLQGMCIDYHLPLWYGDPTKAIPFPCEIVHMGTGQNCEYHALSRFVRSFIWAFSSYLPLNLILTARKPSAKRLVRAFKSSARSSTFLGTFIALFYYGICLTRSRIGPHIFGTSVSDRQSIDGGLCIGGGCVLCGWSVLIENAGRREELGLFVAPRALATLLPRRYLMEDQWKETLAFAASTAVVFTCVGERPERVRGVLGKLLRRVLTQ